MHKPIDLERLITMAEAGKYLAQRTGHRPYLCTLYRWALRGVGGRRLETVQVGRQRYTSVEAVQRFMHARDEQAVAVVTVQPDRPVRVDARADVVALERRVFKTNAAKRAAR
jgi:hypothetical protein